MKIQVIFVLLSTLLCLVFTKSQYKVTYAKIGLTSLSLTLSYTGKDDYFKKPTSPIVKNLNFFFQLQTYDDFYFKITDTDKKRFQIPRGGVFPEDPFANFTYPISHGSIDISYTQNPFDFKIIRKKTGAVIFSTYQRNFVYSDHYLQIGTQVESQYIYGLGQRFVQGFRIKDGKWTMFNKDQGFSIDHGEGKNGYGYFPFYLMRQRELNYHINYFRSSNAMDVFKQTQLGKHFVTYKVIGGIFDFRFILVDQSPKQAIQRLNYMAGRAALPPFWSFGFHQCRWGYTNVQMLNQVLQNYQKHGIPLDTIWTDIDYMNQFEDFTIDEDRFPISEMNRIKQKYRWIPIIDAGIKTSGPAYHEGLSKNIYLKDPYGKNFIGRVWPGETTFVDFFHPKASQYWYDMLETLYQKIKFDGVWLDMNQLSNFCRGPCTTPLGSVIFDYSSDLPYNPGKYPIQTSTVPLNCTHYGNLSQANVHVFHSILQNQATYAFLKSKNIRPFILTRSSSFGTSKYGAHWSGDNSADWQFLQGSISEVFNNQMFGNQMVGADICGFEGDTTVQLCARWYQLGALYPFARSHNIVNARSQQPYALGPIVLKAAQNAIKLRYSLLKQFYTYFVSNRGLGMIWQPLFFAYSFDQNTYADKVADTQFLIGTDILVAPILVKNKTCRQVYFPIVNWHDLYSDKIYSPGIHLISGYQLTDRVPIFIKERTVIFLQDVTHVVNTDQLDNRFHAHVAFKYKPIQSNTTHKVYQALGKILSIKDYRDDYKLDICLQDNCNYWWNIALKVTPQGRTLQVEVQVNYTPLKEQIFVNQWTLHYDKKLFHFVSSQPLEVNGPLRTIIPVPQLPTN